MKRILIAQTGSVGPEVAGRFGDFPHWFARLLAGRAEPVVAGSPAGWEALEPFDGVIVTGSFASVTAPEPWMDALSDRLLVAARTRPVLGVCFGHQLLAEAFGGRVGRSPRGREIGSVACALTAAGRADPLFAGVPGRFGALTTHEDEVVALPPGAVLLATNGWTRVQAFGVGPNVRAVQFHPELDPATLAALVASRAGPLAAEARARGEDGAGAVAAVLAGLRPAPDGARILRSFVAGRYPRTFAAAACGS